MKNKFLLLTWLLAVPLLWAGCDKQNNCPELKLPPLTTEGLNTFGCLIDGEVWVPHVDWQLIQTPLDFGEITVVHYEQENNFYIRVDRRPNGNCDTIKQTFHIGLDVSDYGDAAEIGVVSFNDWNEPRNYRFDSVQVNNVSVLYYSLQRRILSCSFNFSLKDPDSDRKLQITDGRFDLKF